MRRLALQKSLSVNAAALIIGTIATNAFGLAFWAVATHVRDTEIVGRAAAGIAALTLLATVSQLNLTNVFIRLLPAAGRWSRYLIVRGYLAVLALATLIATVYAATGLSANVLAGDWTARVMFVIAVDVLAIFALQDAVLTALRLTPFVPLENISSALLRLGLIPVLIILPSANGLVLAWVTPAALAVIVVNRLLFARALPPLAHKEGSLPDRRRLLSFTAGEYVQSIFATATAQLLPLIIIWRLGPTAAAYFTLPWLILMGITLLLWNVASSFVVEVASNRGHPEALLRRSLMFWGAIVLGAFLICVLGARPLLEIAGANYAAHGETLLRLLGLSVPFTALGAICGTLLWLEQRVWLLAACQAAAATALLVASFVLVPRFGLPAVGLAMITTQALVAAGLAPLAIRRVRSRKLLVAR